MKTRRLRRASEHWPKVLTQQRVSVRTLHTLQHGSPNLTFIFNASVLHGPPHIVAQGVHGGEDTFLVLKVRHTILRSLQDVILPTFNAALGTGQTLQQRPVLIQVTGNILHGLSQLVVTRHSLFQLSRHLTQMVANQLLTQTLGARDNDTPRQASLSEREADTDTTIRILR